MNVSNLDWKRNSQNHENAPAEVTSAYEFYSDNGFDQFTVSKVLVQKRITYAVRIRTDSDSGWLEIFYDTGVLIGAALTWLDVVGWDNQEVIREKFKMKKVRDDWKKLKQLSICYSPEEN